MTVLRKESGTTWDEVEIRSQADNQGYQIYQKRNSESPEWSLGGQPSVTVDFLEGLETDPLAQINQGIEDSRSLMSLPDCHAEGGADPCTAATWRRATTFLKRHAVEARQRAGFVVPAPAILPGPDGSIDLHWKTESYELLLNIPADPAVPATFYADDFGIHTTKGSFDPAGPSHELIFWLTDRLAKALITAM